MWTIGLMIEMIDQIQYQLNSFGCNDFNEIMKRYEKIDTVMDCIVYSLI